MNQILNLTTNKQTRKKECDNEKTTSTNQQLLGKHFIVLFLEMLLALPLSLILAKLNFGGVAWVFGGIVSGALVLQGYRIVYNYTLKPHRSARKTGMVLVGLNVGFSIAHSHLASVTSYVPIFTFLTFFLLICGTGIGYGYSRLSKTNLLTALLATVPGGVGLMSAIAADYNRNVSLVALVQAIRVTTVIFLIPLIARVSSGSQVYPQALPAQGALLSFEPSQLGLLFLALLFSVLLVYIAVLSRIPSAEFFGAIVAGILFNSILNLLPFIEGIHLALPPLVNIVGQLLLGITIGEYWGNKPTLGKKTIVYAFISVAMTLIAGGIATLLAMQLTSWDWLTCLLVTAPGGAAEMILVALSLHHNVEIVTAGHLVRLIAINSSIPIWIYLFRRLDSQVSKTA